MHGPGALPPVGSWRQAPPIHTPAGSPTSAGVERSCPVQPGRASVCPTGRPLHPGLGRASQSVLHTPAPPLPGYNLPQRRRAGGRGAVPLLRGDHSSRRWCCAPSADAQADRAAHRSKAGGGERAAPRAPVGGAASARQRPVRSPGVSHRVAGRSWR